MLDRPVRRLIDPWLEIPARRLQAAGITANTVTWMGFTLGIVAAFFIAREQYIAGLVALLGNRLCDGVDGTLARLNKPTDLGGFLDIVLDMIFYASVPLAFALADERNAIAAAFLIFSFIGTSGSFLAFAIISAKRGVTADAEGKKSFFYSVGLMEGTETVGFLIAFCLFPGHFVTLAMTFAALCMVTTCLRVGMAMQVFSDR